jgi:hypothetical protein
MAQSFLERHASTIAASVSCFDRVIFKGYLKHLSHPSGMMKFLDREGVLLKDFERFVSKHTERIVQAAKDRCAREGRPYTYLNSYRIDKDATARQTADSQQIREGLVCCFSVVERTNTFRMVGGKGAPKLVSAMRPCLCLYFYFIDPRFGFMHVRLASWFPFTVQIYMNGHQWLQRRLDAEGIGYELCENYFPSVAEPERVQEISDGFANLNFQSILSDFAAQVNPLLADLLRGGSYYWVTDQAEYATDVIFADSADLEALYPELLRHAVLEFSAEDIMTFLGKDIRATATGDPITNCYRRRPGARVKHRAKGNWIKMYDKATTVLRIETVINDPYQFKVRRRGMKAGRPVTAWFPLCKSVAYLYRYAEVAAAANRRYLDALAPVPQPRQIREQLHELTHTVEHNGRGYGGFNPAAADTIALFLEVMKGEHILGRFRNGTVAQALYGPTDEPAQKRRHAARAARRIKKLHLRGYVGRIPRTRAWTVTAKGYTVLGACVRAYHDDIPQLMQNQREAS